MLILGQPRSKLIKKLLALGPYLRENECSEQQFFFDCLAVCANARQPTEKREFWGWWLSLQVDSAHQALQYQYHFGFYDSQGDWMEKTISDRIIANQVQESLQLFYPRLNQLLQSLDIELQPAPGVCGIVLNTAA